jgi:hypothetical protein
MMSQGGEGFLDLHLERLFISESQSALNVLRRACEHSLEYLALI